MLLPQTHSPEVDYSLFIMETVEMSMEKKETSLAGLRRSFPPPICSLLVSVSGFVFLRRLLLENVGGPCIQALLGHEDASGRRIDSNGATRGAHTAPVPGRVGPSLLALRPPFVDFFRSKILSLKNNDPPKFIAHYDVVKVLKQLKKEKGVFCLCRINSIKG